MRFGIFGGTFDPPHVGHLILAMEAYDQLHLDKVLWIIAPNPPHKLGKPITPIDQRIAMVKTAIDGDEMFALSRVDIDRPGPHYVLDTMLILHDHYPDDKLFSSWAAIHCATCRTGMTDEFIDHALEWGDAQTGEIHLSH